MNPEDAKPFQSMKAPYPVRESTSKKWLRERYANRRVRSEKERRLGLAEFSQRYPHDARLLRPPSHFCEIGINILTEKGGPWSLVEDGV
jgi:hypothetical protein